MRQLVATYRLQLRNGLDLDGVADRWVDVLTELGVSHIYLSPIFTAVNGSTHGYDVTDHSQVDPVLGGEDALARLAARAHEAGLGIIVDLVPNHMATDPAGNRRWWDVLRNGRSSVEAGLFDLDWEVPERRLHGRILLPVLGDHCGREIDAGRFSADVTPAGEPVVVHPSITAPLELSSLAPTLSNVAEELDSAELAALARAAADLPPHDEPDPQRRAVRVETEFEVRAALHRLLAADESTASAVRTALRQLANDPVALDGLLELQPYRLARWEAGLEDLGYRRFFDVTTLVALRADQETTFDVTHEAVRRWIDHGWIDGVRVDHVDGLADPAGYLARLRQIVDDRPIWVEKILETGERLPESWPVAGTTGYESTEYIHRLDVDDRGRAVLERLAESTGAPTDVHAAEVVATRDVLRDLLAADVHRLVELIVRCCDSRRRLRDTTRHEVRRLVVDVVSHLGRYRTYVVSGEPATPEDIQVIEQTIGKVGTSTHDPDLVDFVAQLMRGEVASDDEAEVCTRMQQLTGPARAKGCEDTAWYRLLALLSRCDVGSNPNNWGVELADFHSVMENRQLRFPTAMSASTTHDSKRSADVRSRIDLLSRHAEQFAGIVERWWERSGAGPDNAMDLAILQTMIGVPDLDDSRLVTWAEKAVREAKVRTSWLAPDDRYETQVRERAREALGDSVLAEELRDLEVTIGEPARRLVLTRTALSLTLPGIPDLYQGTESWSHTLVDPDNRSPVDPSLTAALLSGLGDSGGLLGVGPEHVTAKLALTRLCLEVRRRHPEAFGPCGGYRPLWATGPRADRVVAFERAPDVVVASERLTDDPQSWGDTTLTLPDGNWVNRCDGSEHEVRVEVSQLLRLWPVALLERQ